jgi:predicted permease
MRLASDLRLGLRGVLRAPGFAAAVVGTLALGIGLASGMGAVARAVAFAPLPVREQERVVVLWGENRQRSFAHVPVPLAGLQEFARTSRTMEAVAGMDYNGAWAWTFRAPDRPLRYKGSLVTGDWARTLGVVPVLGRALRPEDDVPGAPRVMVISHALWRRAYGGDSTVLGRTLTPHAQGVPYTIVGVMPPGLDVPRGVEFWTPIAPSTTHEGKSWAVVDVVGRLRPGATPEAARAELTAFVRRALAARSPMYAGVDATVRGLPEFAIGDVRPALAATSAAAALVLLIACVNVAGLVLVRTGRRQQELAVRAALGAGRPRLLRQLLAEHAVLALLGGALGAGVAALAVRGFAALAPAELPRIAEVRVDASLLALATAVTALVVVLVGLLPAAAGARVSVADTLRRHGRGVFGGRGARTARRGLVTLQVALALVILAGAGLVTRSLARLQAVDLGLATERVAIAQLVAGGSLLSVGPDAKARFRHTLDQVLARVRAVPGVVDVAPVVLTPFSGTSGWDGLFEAEGVAPGDSSRAPWLNMESTSAAYARTTGVALRQGRFLLDTDDERAPLVVVLSEGAARRMWPGEDPIGKRVRFPTQPWRTVVGVVADTRYRDLVEPRPTIYFPHRQFDQPPNFLAIRAAADAGAVLPAVRAAVAEVAPDLLVAPSGTLGELAAAPLARPRLNAALLGAFAVVAVVLTAVGLFGVVAASLAQRARELGVRAALGARPRDLARLALREGVGLAVVGVAVGLAAALAGTRVLERVLFEVAPTDPLALGGAVALLLAVCAAACLVPARRAARVDPVTVLRAE